jgi:hypothetical protein
MSEPQPVTIVCLPDRTPVADLAATAAAQLTPTGTVTPVAFFRTHRRWRTARLLLPGNHTAAGGPVHLLDLATMAAHGRTASAARFAIWQHVVAETKPAQPFWTFLERHRTNPKTYTVDQAQQHYLAQSRIAAMRTYNLLHNRLAALPTGQLEAFQAGGNTYTHLAGLTALTGTALITLDGRRLHPDSERLADLITYVDQAHAYLRGLPHTHQLVALITA